MKRGRNAVRAAAVALALATATACSESPLDPSELEAQTAPQETGTAEAGRRGLLEHAQELGLTSTQVQQVEGILEDLQAANAPLLARLRPASGGRPERAGARELMEQVRENSRAAHEQILALLTDAQREQVRGLGPRRGDGQDGPGRGFARRGPGGPGGPGGPAAAMNLLRRREQLELTEAQVTQVRAIADELRAQNEPLLQQLRDGGERPQPDNPVMQQIRANVEAATERMLGVLTAAQRTELDQLRAQMQERRGEMGDGPRRRPGGRGGLRN
jgi:Spy/CpxP family protein refolding chaperone